MRRSLVLLGLSLAACGGEDVLPPPTGQVTGALRLVWSFVDGDGNAQTCEEARVEDISLELGRTPEVWPCSQGSVTYGNLLPDRYPVIAEAIAVSGVPRARLMTNAQVTAGSTTTFPLAFVIDPVASQRGDVRIPWRIDGRTPRAQCALVGADFAHVVAGSASIDTFDVRVPCVDGEVLVRDLRLGVYEPQVRLEAADGTRLFTGIGDAFRIEANQIIDSPVVNVVTRTGPPTQITALWTIGSTTATTACALVGGRTVTVATVPRAGIVPTSTTVPCSRGVAHLIDGVGVGTIDVRLSLAYGIAAVTSTLVEDVVVRRAQTSTVSFDFRPE